LREYAILMPRSENRPAKVKDPGIIELVKAGLAAYNAKNGELLFLPEGDRLRRELVSRLKSAMLRDDGVQSVDCGSDDAVFSLAERYVREWGDSATSFSDERGRDLFVLGWSLDKDEAVSRIDAIKRSILRELPEEGGFSFVDESLPEGGMASVLISRTEAGALGARPGFACPGCDRLFLPDSPLGYDVEQPGETEQEEPLEDIETPGANTIAELCNQLGIGVERTLKAMLYIALDGSNRRHPVTSFVRGDFNVSMNKLSAWLALERGLTKLRTAEKSELYEMLGEVAGYCGPVGLPESVVLVCDSSVRGSKNTVVGANRSGYHRKGCCHGRDFDPPITDISQPAQGSPCSCGTRLESAILRESGRLALGDVKNGKTLSYRDRDGIHEYPVEYRGVFSTESIILASHAAFISPEATP
jgi:prolyl-tRNA synthetase